MAVPVMKKTGRSKEKEEEEGNSSSPSPLLMVNNNGKGKQVQVFVDYHNPPPLQESSSSSFSAPLPTLPQFPPGFRFAPKESELIIDYLQKKVLGKPISYYPNPVVERDLYGNEEPSQICRALGKAEHEDLYVFTLPRSRSGGTHMSRRAGNGTWKGDHKAKDCYDDMGTLIGCRTALTFFHNMTKRTSWIMHQYTLPVNTKAGPFAGYAMRIRPKRRASAVPLLLLLHISQSFTTSLLLLQRGQGPMIKHPPPPHLNPPKHHSSLFHPMILNLVSSLFY